MHGIVVLIHTLHQQGPAGLLQRRQTAALERTLPERPALRLAHDQARLDGFLAGQIKQLRAAQKRFEGRDGLADQQGFFLPVAAHELRRRQTAQQAHRDLRDGGRGLRPSGFGFEHGTIVG
ncbi:hypothetical protein D9M69_657220 [compost metagenome]